MSRVAIAAVRTGRPREIYKRRDGETDWDSVAQHILGPAVTPADRERRRSDALALARAALKAAGVERLPD
ncbi:hypothetical protein [Burkholderia multivorans]|uniref:hypothetical protein n=1 Tax=Burkholderia multivorans TaxID=87883 RepID=UPI000CFF632B|nr:hypothetical protein [Burkholderia multivorans]PRG37572.1 hypothetical protein C6T62_15175 [Burkholderia multivorans]